MLKTLLLFSLCILPTMTANATDNSLCHSDSITLTTTNSLTIKGPVTEEATTEFIYALNKMKNKENIYIYLDTPGGSVEHGNKIVSEIQKYKLNCIAERAYSMGFVILQACKNRYITSYGRIMQHQISYGVSNEKAKVESYVSFVNQLEDELTEMQAARIGISSEEFSKRTYNDWWMVGKKAILANCADRLAHVKCSVKLTKENYTINNGWNELTYSKCPLVSGHIAKKSIEGKNSPFIFYVEN